MSLNSKKILQPPNKHWIFIILVLSLFISSCNAKYKQTELIEGMYYPNGKVLLEGRPVANPNKNYDITLSQPLHINEIGVLKLAFFNQDSRKEYWKVGGGVVSFEVGKTKIPSLGEYYIPVYLLKKTGRFEYHERTLTFIEWIRDNPILTIFISIVLLIVVIIVSKYTINNQQMLRLQKQKETEDKRLREIREEELRKEREIEQRKNIVLEIVNNLYKETAREVHKTILNTLFLELQDILNILNSDKLNDAIISGNKTAFQNQINFIKSELQRLKKLALDAQLKGSR